jgi:tRNA-dihydrouridine synthase A
VPPLDYGRVYRLKAARPGLTVVINGGIKTLDEAARHLESVDGVMLGRAAYQNPAMLADVDARLYGETGAPGLAAVFEAMTEYAARRHAGEAVLHPSARWLTSVLGARACRHRPWERETWRRRGGHAAGHRAGSVRPAQ